MLFDQVSLENIKTAVNDLKVTGIPDGFSRSRFYDVKIDGILYPPKPIMAVANYYATGKTIGNYFSGGKNTPCFAAFERLGLQIISKSDNLKELKIFQIIVSKSQRDEAGKLLQAKLQINKNDYLLLKGSYLYKEQKPSFKDHNYERLRRKFETNEYISDTPFNGFFLLKKDIVFNSPSAAASMVLNRAANGRTEWKLDNGVSLEQFENNLSANDNNKQVEFNIHSNEYMETTKFWIEKTIVTGRTDREKGDRALGKSLWSPQKDKRGADIYKNMRLIKPNDIIIHLINNREISGVSVVKNPAVNTNGITGTDWTGKSYLIELKDYIGLEKPIARDRLLNDQNKNLLEKISATSEVFYTNKLNLRQGAYITPCPNQLASLINEIYLEQSKRSLPHFEKHDLEKFEVKENMKLDIHEFVRNLNESGLFFNNSLVTRFVTSLVTKPFVLLSGLSGSGKTKLAQVFAEWISQDKNQYCIVPVGADWTNREPLLGYVNAIENANYIEPENGALRLILNANHNPEKPYFLILDEMNLSHVERYFADFLSVMESKDDFKLHDDLDNEKSGVPNTLSWPTNLFVVGTVNIDETTYMFSPKVLDRANVIEFRVQENEIEQFLEEAKDITSIAGLGSNMGESFLKLVEEKANRDNLKNLNSELVSFFKELQSLGSEFGYRTAFEIQTLFSKIDLVNSDYIDLEDEKIDIAIMQKLLPKLHGSRRKLIKTLELLAQKCLIEEVDRVFNERGDSLISKENIKYNLSFEKLSRMYKNVIDNGFTSYAEA
jgi:hypothetical protein